MIPLHDDNPTRIRPYVGWSLIAACVVIYLYQLSLPHEQEWRLVYALGFIPATVLGDARLPPDMALVPPLLTPLTSMFLHGGLLHLLGNMLYLYVFGNNIEDIMGHRRFIVFYVVCGLAAAGTQAAVDPASTTPMIGASGAISGVLGAYLVTFPKSRILVLVPIGFILTTWRLPAMLILGLWFLLQLVQGTLSAGVGGGGGGVAWWAHIGGFVAGMALIRLFRRRPPPPPRRPGRPTVRFLRRPRRRAGSVPSVRREPTGTGRRIPRIPLTPGGRTV